MRNIKAHWIAIATWLIIGLGVLLRLAVFLHNRNLFIDEANIARNVYERTFAGLAMPLSYEQYAPPIFMWILKICTTLFGFSEYAFRLYPFVTGIGAMLLFVAIMKEFGAKKGFLYPLFLIATGLIYLRYATEAKQYMPDTFIALLLVWYAMRIDIFSNSVLRFVVIWTVIGTPSIWSSMPSVFVLAGVGVYYATCCFKQHDTKKLMPIIIVSILWLMQFLFYYVSILQPQANSEYLHNYHKDFFIFLWPKDLQQLQHNIKLVGDILAEAGGYTALTTIFNGLMIIWGAVVLLRKHPEKALLIIVPAIALFIAAGADQFSLIPRVSLFIMPFILLLIGYGFDLALRIPSKIAIGVLVIVAGIGAYNHSKLQYFVTPLKNEEITEGMQLFKDHKLTRNDVYIHAGAAPAFIYYTEIHPARAQWESLVYAHVMDWRNNYDTIVNGKKVLGLLYANCDESEINAGKDAALKHLKLTASIVQKGSSVYIYGVK